MCARDSAAAETTPDDSFAKVPSSVLGVVTAAGQYVRSSFLIASADYLPGFNSLKSLNCTIYFFAAAWRLESNLVVTHRAVVLLDGYLSRCKFF